MNPEQVRPPTEASVVRYIFVRLLLCAGLFGLAAAAVLAQPWVMFTMSALFHVATAVFVFMAVSAAGIRRHGTKPWFRWLQLIFDTILVTTLVWLSDGPRSPFFVLYFMNIVAASWLLPRWGALAVAGIDAIAFLATTTAGLYGLTEWEVISGGIILYTEMTLRVFSLFLVGILSGFLAENLQRTRTALLASEQTVEQLLAEHHVVLNQLDTGILVVDESGEISAVNPAGSRILGPVLGKPLSEVLAPRANLWEQAYRARGKTRVLVCRSKLLDRGGTVVVVEDITDWRGDGRARRQRGTSRCRRSLGGWTSA